MFAFSTWLILEFDGRILFVGIQIGKELYGSSSCTSDEGNGPDFYRNDLMLRDSDFLPDNIMLRGSTD